MTTKTLDEAIRLGKSRYAEMPMAFPSEEHSVKYAVAEFIWNQAEKWRQDLDDPLRVLDLLQKITA